MKAYLAGPDVFSHAAKEKFAEMRRLCSEHGITALAPIDAFVPEHWAPEAKASGIFAANVMMLRECDIVIANISPFRGPSCDPGTAWELGFAHALGKKVYAYSGRPSVYGIRLRDMFDVRGRIMYGCEMGDVVEEFGLIDNLMIAVPLMDPVSHTFAEAVLRVALDAFKAKQQDVA